MSTSQFVFKFGMFNIMKRLLLVVVCFLALHSGAGLKCKRCMDRCEKEEIEYCLSPGHQQKIACLTATYTYADAPSRQLKEKKCVLFSKDIPKYKCLLPPGGRQITCDTCNTDFCNSSPSTTTRTIFFAILPIIVTCKFL